jgi:hypothetical protein
LGKLGIGQTGHWPNRALGIGKIYKAIFAQIMNNFYSLLLLFSLPSRPSRLRGSLKKDTIANHKKLLYSKTLNV